MKRMLVLLLLLAGLSIYGQQNKYFVFLTSGEVWIKTPGHAAAKAKPKQVIQDNDVIELRKDNAEVAIANVSGYYYVFRDKGSYGMNDIHKIEKSRPPGITPKFLSYLYEDMIHPQKTGRTNKDAIAASWGAGSRGNECLQLKAPGDGLVSSKDTLVFRWAHNNKILSYNFIMYDHDGGQILNCIVRDTQFIIRTAPLRNVDNQKFSWSVNAVAKPCPNTIRQQFELVSPAEEKKRIDKLVEEVPQNDNETLYNLAVADLLGLNGFYDKAFEYFSNARKSLANNR